MRTLLLALTLAAAFALAAHAQDGDGGGGGGFIKTPYNTRPEVEHHDGITVNVWDLSPPENDSKAHAKVTVHCYSDDKDNFRLDAHDLDPHSVYSVWFTTSLKEGADRAGVGTAPYSFKTGGGGGVLYQTPLKTCPLIKYKWVVILKHPDGDPRHLDNAVRFLEGRMIQE
jgi:hypothetical protein